MATQIRNVRDRWRELYHSHRNTCIYAFMAFLFGVVLAVAINDRVQVEERLDKTDDRLRATDDRLRQTDRRLARALRQLRRLAFNNREAVRRLERLENPTTRDLRRLFRGLFRAATPRELKRLVRNLREVGIRVIGVPEGRGFGQNPAIRRGGGRGGGPPPGQPGPSGPGQPGGP